MAHNSWAARCAIPIFIPRAWTGRPASFNTVANTIRTASENLAAGNSRIRDVDVAEETSAMSRSQILVQAGVSVLAQANQMPQMAMKLLG